MGFKARPSHPSKAPAGYRFNRERLYRALDTRRRKLTYGGDHFDERELSWREVGRQAGVFEMTILRLPQGMGPTMESYGRLCAWLGVELDEFFD